MITFVNPASPFLVDEGVMPPLGLMYLASTLSSKGIKTQIVDIGLGEEVPDGELFITGTTPQEEEIIKLRRNPYTVVGGPHASIDSDSLKDIFSLVVAGEGEEVIESIVREKPVGVIKTRRITKLDELPFPDRSKSHKYRYDIGGRKATTMITSRGCTGKCSFCCKAVMNNGIYLRSAENVLQEVREIRELGFGAVMFYDDSIAINKKRIIEICRGFEKMDMLYRCFVRSDQVDDELFKRMAQSGCHEVLIGVESGSQIILDNIRKQETIQQHKEAIELAKINGIRVKAAMIVGLPGETWSTVEESRKFIIETSPDALDVTILSVYKGCDIYNNPLSYELTFMSPKWFKGRNDEYESTVSTPAMTGSDIVEARNYLWETFMKLHE